MTLNASIERPKIQVIWIHNLYVLFNVMSEVENLLLQHLYTEI